MFSGSPISFTATDSSYSEEFCLEFGNWCRIHDSKYPNEVWLIQQLFEKFKKERILRQANQLRVLSVNSEGIFFENGFHLTSEHAYDCCEMHYLDFSKLDLSEFENLLFNLNDDLFFRRIEDFGIELIPTKGFSIKIPGYGHNNGYYSTNLTLVILKDNEIVKSYPISECQTIFG